MIFLPTLLFLTSACRAGHKVKGLVRKYSVPSSKISRFFRFKSFPLRLLPVLPVVVAGHRFRGSPELDDSGPDVQLLPVQVAAMTMVCCCCFCSLLLSVLERGPGREMRFLRRKFRQCRPIFLEPGYSFGDFLTEPKKKSSRRKKRGKESAVARFYF